MSVVEHTIDHISREARAEVYGKGRCLQKCRDNLIGWSSLCYEVLDGNRRSATIALSDYHHFGVCRITSCICLVQCAACRV